MQLNLWRSMLAVLAVVIVVALVVLLFRYAGFFPDAAERLPSGSTRDFADGNGIYYYNEGKYNILYWKKKLFTPGQPPDEREIKEAANAAIPVRKGVRFFSYGLQLAYWPVVPPYAMAFCIIRDRSIEGVFPLRIKLIERQGPTYELVPPDLFGSLTPGVLWAINYQYACTDGWVFRFQ